QLADGDAGRRQLDARFTHMARDREAAQAPAAVPAEARPPVDAPLDDVADPEQRLDIVDQGRPAEQADLGREWRLVPGQAAPPLDAFQHRRFLAADIGACAATEMHPRM